MSRMSDILNEYEEIRQASKAKTEENKKRAFSRIPRLKEIEAEMVKISLEITKSILNKSDNVDELLSTLQNRLLDLKIEKAELLMQNNFPKDYLEIKYNCPTCKDTGFVEGKKCKCYIQKEIDYLYKQSNMQNIIRTENFEHFKFDYYPNEVISGSNISPLDNIKKIYQACVYFVRDFDSSNKNLLFIGKTGLGKTFLSHSIAKKLLDSGRSVIYQTASELIDLIRKYKFDFDNEDNNAPLLNELYCCDLLIIDDLGTELSTQFSNLALYNIINKRLINKKSMIISTNLDIDELINLYSGRITSRIFGNFETYEFIGKDIRLQKHQII